VNDLELAKALAAGDRRALKIFEEDFLPKIDRALRRVDSSPAFIDEVKQSLRKKLLVADGDKPALITQYSGRGALDRWLKLAAVRVALNMKRSVRREQELEEEVLGALTARDDPELEVVWRTFRKKYEQALASALKELEPRERLLLEQHFVDGLGLDELAEAHGAHRTTVFRRLKSAQAALRDSARAHLSAQGIDPSMMRSVERAAGSRFQLSIVRILKGAASK